MQKAFNVASGLVGTATWYGEVKLNFLSDPASPNEFPYWGLRVGGNQIEELSALTSSPVRLQWDTGGLSPASLERFGIHYDGGADRTYIGVAPPQGTLIMLK